jgi:hypothetical protein
VFRRSDELGYAVVGTASTNSYSDTTVAPATSYLYTVAVTAPATSNPSTPDLATSILFTDGTLTPGFTPIKRTHLSELRAAVVSLCALAGSPPPCNVGLTDASLSVGTVVKAIHYDELRVRLIAARQALGLAIGQYTPIVSGAVIRATDVRELRQGIE